MEQHERIKNKREKRADEGSRTCYSAWRAEYDWKEGNSTLLLLLAGTPERHRRLPENRMTCASPCPAGLQQRSRISPSVCLNNRTISEEPAARAQRPRDRNKLDPTWRVWDIKPCSMLKVSRRFGGIYLAHSSILRMEIRSSETSVNFQRTTWRYIKEDSSHHNHRCENLISGCTTSYTVRLELE
jgi:hypothetical protein